MIASEFFTHWMLGYLCLGAFAGFFAGMLGIGGGLVMVPALALFFTAQGFSPLHVLHLALGTSMATIIFTAISSLKTHHTHGAVRWDIVRVMTPGILVGTALGTALARAIPTNILAIFFAGFVVFVALQMAFNLKAKPHRQLPGKPALVGVGSVIGGLSSLVAIGGGSLTVPYLSWCNVPVHHAIGTSAAMGLPIAIGGTLGYIINGWSAQNLPLYSVGFIYLPALLGLLITSILFAPLGARTAHRLPVATLKRIFSVVLLLLAAKMLFGLFK